MRQRISYRFVIALGCAMIATSATRILAESGHGVSTIRLTSATEPIAAGTVATRSPQPAFRQPSMATRQASYQQPAPQPISPRHAIDFYAARAVSERLSQMPRQAAVRSSTIQPANPRRAKPFQSVRAAPTISPYLYLDREERDNKSLPTYLAFVRPQLEQNEANQHQQQEMQKYRGQMRNAPQVVVMPQQAGAGRGPAHYMDTAQYYRGLQ